MSEPQAMRNQPRWQLAALIPLAVGLFWLASGWSHAWGVAILAALAGVPILGCGTAMLSIGSHILGSTFTLGVDIDEAALAIAAAFDRYDRYDR